MKNKIILSLVAWLLGAGCAWADGFVINDITIPQGGEVEVPIGYLIDSGKTFVGFQLRLELPEGVSTVKDADKLPIYEVDATSLGTSFNLTATPEDGFAALPKALTSSIKGTSGTLITITLAADAALEVGSELTANVILAMYTSKDADGNLATVDIPDFTFKITIGEPDDGRIKFDEAATKLPEYTAGEKGDVTLKRTIKANTWSTIVLPFNLTKANATAIFGSDVEFAKFSGFEVDYGDDEENVTPLGITINFTSYSIPARGNLAGGTPVLIRTSKDINEIVLDQVTLAEGVKDEEKADEYGTAGKFTGSFVKTTVPADGLFLNSNKFYYSTGKTAIKAFRGWFELDAVLNQETDFGVKMVIDGFETKVEGVSVKDASGAIFDLSGRKMNAPTHRGVYIIGGKKVVINK
ncbi:MAG: hypothetical protein IJ699_08230 [Bacteroidaceae bacterium]|nr:hypothetical protein [Bacteroidaceae bacterium]